jgi:hypothetical protein
VNRLRGNWQDKIFIATGYSYTCGYCGTLAGPSRSYKCTYLNQSSKSTISSGHLYICPNCNRPTFIADKEQVPGPILGGEIEHLPDGIQELYQEARKCVSVNAFTSAVLSCRKLLMNVSVTKGADHGKSFAFYVTFLEDNHFIPPGSREWVDHIRKKGNEATHEIPSISQEDAIELLEFTEMLLRFVYELPGKMTRHVKV